VKAFLRGAAGGLEIGQRFGRFFPKLPILAFVINSQSRTETGQQGPPVTQDRPEDRPIFLENLEYVFMIMRLAEP
jgi:hypothetical protein